MGLLPPLRLVVYRITFHSKIKSLCTVKPKEQEEKHIHGWGSRLSLLLFANYINWIYDKQVYLLICFFSLVCPEGCFVIGDCQRFPCTAALFRSSDGFCWCPSVFKLFFLQYLQQSGGHTRQRVNTRMLNGKTTVPQDKWSYGFDLDVILKWINGGF